MSAGTAMTCGEQPAPRPHKVEKEPSGLRLGRWRTTRGSWLLGFGYRADATPIRTSDASEGHVSARSTASTMSAGGLWERAQKSLAQSMRLMGGLRLRSPRGTAPRPHRGEAGGSCLGMAAAAWTKAASHGQRLVLGQDSGMPCASRRGQNRTGPSRAAISVLAVLAGLMVFDVQAQSQPIDPDGDNVGLLIRPIREGAVSEAFAPFEPGSTIMESGVTRVRRATESRRNRALRIETLPVRLDGTYDSNVFYVKDIRFSPSSEFDISDFARTGSRSCPTLTAGNQAPNINFPHSNMVPVFNSAAFQDSGIGNLNACTVRDDDLVEGAEMVQMEIDYTREVDDTERFTVSSNEFEVFDMDHATMSYTAPATVQEGETLDLTFTLSLPATFDLYAHWRVIVPATPDSGQAGEQDFVSAGTTASTQSTPQFIARFIEGTSRIPVSDGGRTFTVPTARISHELGLLEPPEAFQIEVQGLYEDAARSIPVRVECVTGDIGDDDTVNLRTCISLTASTHSVDILQFDKPVVTGNHVVPQELRADHTYLVDTQAQSVPVTGHQWERADDEMGTGATDISGATSQAYRLVNDDGGKYVRVTTTVSVGGSAEERSSEWILVNSPATGNPVIEGPAIEGERLTASTMTPEGTSRIMDINGLTGVDYQYQWERATIGQTNWTDISGATGNTYDLIAADVGRMIRVLISFVDDDGFPEMLMTNSVTVNTPAVGDLEIDDGTMAQVDVELMADTTGITDADGMNTPNWRYLWERADDEAGSGLEEISGAVSAAYTPTKANDQGKFLRVTATFTDDLGFEETKRSVWTREVERRANTAAAGEVTIIDDTPSDGMTTVQEDVLLDANISTIEDLVNMLNDAENMRNDAEFKYQWWRADDNTGAGQEAIAGAHNKEYVPVDDDSMHVLRVVVTFKDDDGYDETKTSEWTSAVQESDNTDAVGDVVIENDPQPADGITVVKVDVELKADPSDIDDPANGLTPPVDWHYQWERADDAAGTTNLVPIGGDSETYTPVKEDEGRFLRVNVRFMDDDHWTEIITSSWTTRVERRDDSPATGEVTAENDPQPSDGITVVKVDVDLTAITSTIDDRVNGLTTPHEDWRYRWERADDAAGTAGLIDVGTDRIYTPVKADEDKYLRVHVTFTDDDDYEETKISDWSSVVEKRDNVPATGEVTVEGGAEAQVDVELAADASTIDDLVNGLTSQPEDWQYQWVRADDATGTGVADIPGETSDSYTPVKADEGKFLRVEVTFTDDDDYEETKMSDWTRAVARRDNMVAVGQPTISSDMEDDPAASGTVLVGTVLTAITDDITDGNGMTEAVFEFQWFRADGREPADVFNALQRPEGRIPGARSRTYTIVDEDLNKHLFVQVTFTDDDGYEETPTSDPTDPVVKAGRQREAIVLEHFLSGFSYSAAATLVDTIWRRVKNHRITQAESHAVLGGQTFDAASFASGDMNRAALEVAKFLGVEIEPASKAEYSGEQGSLIADGDAEAYRNWAGIPDSSGLAERSAFALPLTEGAGGTGSTVVWGIGDIRSFKSGSDRWEDQSFSMDGSITGGSVGIDRYIDNTLVGLVVMGSEGEADFAFDNALLGKGIATAGLTTIAPWIHWKSQAGAELWTTIGSGTGTAGIKSDSGASVETDITYNVIAAGFRGITRDYQGMNATTKVDAFIAESTSDRTPRLDSTNGEVSRLRLALETSTQRMLIDESLLDYSVEFGVRYDDGEAQTGGGMDMLATIQYTIPNSGWTMHAHSSYLVQHQQDDLDEWALGGGVDWDSGVRDRGLQLSLSPTWNTAPPAGFSEAMWSDSGSGIRESQASGAALLARLSYGTDILWKRALAMTYGEMEGNANGRRVRLGAELQQMEAVMGSISVDLYGERSSGASGSDNAVMLETAIGF